MWWLSDHPGSPAGGLGARTLRFLSLSLVHTGPLFSGLSTLPCSGWSLAWSSTEPRLCHPLAMSLSAARGETESGSSFAELLGNWSRLALGCQPVSLHGEVSGSDFCLSSFSSSSVFSKVPGDEGSAKCPHCGEAKHPSRLETRPRRAVTLGLGSVALLSSSVLLLAQAREGVGGGRDLLERTS